MTQAWSPASGFVIGGALNARPTAADEIILGSGTWLGGQASAYRARVHVMTSTDGRGTRVLVGVTTYNNASICLFWLFDQAKNPVTGWTNYNVALSTNNSVNNPVTTHWNLANTARVRGVHGAIAMSMYMSNESTYRTSLGSKGVVRIEHLWAKNDFSGEWPLTTIGLTSQTGGATGRHGQLYDIWFGSDLMSGKTYPNTLVRDFAQFHSIVLPWNGEGVLIRG